MYFLSSWKKSWFAPIEIKGMYNQADFQPGYGNFVKVCDAFLLL
jgi:hypothetical protein